MHFHFIGDETTLIGYRFAGVHGTAVTTKEEAEAAFQEVCKRKDVSVLLITDLVYSQIEELLIAHKRTGKQPFLVTVKDYKKTQVNHKTLENLIYEAVGIRLDNKN